MKWRIESDFVKFEPHMSEMEKQEMVFVVTDVLKQFLTTTRISKTTCRLNFRLNQPMSVAETQGED